MGVFEMSLSILRERQHWDHSLGSVVIYSSSILLLKKSSNLPLYSFMMEMKTIRPGDRIGNRLFLDDLQGLFFLQF